MTDQDQDDSELAYQQELEHQQFEEVNNHGIESNRFDRKKLSELS